ncbi:MAG: hypothetical protein NTX25_05925 [Proteobacteria bacterium]|nr:hypothetical protein [Pseudomonadota bacterium]
MIPKSYLLKRNFSWIASSLVMISACKTTNSRVKEAESSNNNNAQMLKLSLNDASMLFPLVGLGQPRFENIPLGPSDGTGTAHGPLIPPSIWDAVATQTRNVNIFKQIFAGRGQPPKLIEISPIAVRFDPCAPKPSDNSVECLHQVRLVWQPSILDAAIHSIYNVSDAEFRAIVQRISQLKAQAGFNYDNEPLGVQPVLAKEGMGGPFGSGLIELLRTYLGEYNLMGVAFFEGDQSSVGSAGPWRFAAFTYQNHQFVPTTIPHLQATVQEIRGFPSINIPRGNNGLKEVFDTIIPPVVEGSDLKIGTNYTASGGLGTLDAAAQEQAYANLLKIENPRLTAVNENRCADCHVASLQRAIADTMVPELAKKPFSTRFEPILANPNQMIIKTGTLHNFGYFQNTVSISQRTVNETKAALDIINQKYLAN